MIKANLALKEHSQKMSRQMTRTEQLVWFNILSKKQLLNYKFTKQKIIANYIIDFYCSELFLGLEIDGESHNGQPDYDRIRTEYLNSIGIKILRFTNIEILQNLEGVKIYLENYIRSNC